MKKKKLSRGIIISIIILILSLGIIYPVLKGIHYGLDLKGGFEVLYQIEPLNGKKVTTDDILNTYKSINNRIDTLGVSEPEITLEGDKIRVKLPGVTNEDEARKRLSTPAVLTFRDTSDNELMNAGVLSTPGAKLDYKDGLPVVALSIKDNDTFYKVTKRVSESASNTITIWLDYEEGDSFATSKCGEDSTKCISAATVSEAFSGNVIIQGNFSVEEAQTLVDLINSGSLPTKLNEISTKTVDASFGAGTLKTVGIAGIITLIIITLIMVFTYRLSGLISSICLLFYTIMVFVVFNAIGGVLTLTGLAALILGIGMAIDSSVITLEKIKEELSLGSSLKEAYKKGNSRSLISLIDANATTLIAAIVLFVFGESSVKGFATMLIITIVVSVLAMILLNRFILTYFINSEKFYNKESILVGKIKERKAIKSLKSSIIYLVTICVIFILGISFGFINKLNLGIDFKGGSSITVRSTDKISVNKVETLLEDYTIREAQEVSESEYYFIISETLNEKEINELKSTLIDNGYKTDISVISNVVKTDLVKNAVKSLVIAFVCVLIYVAIRFTSHFAVSAILAVLSDILVTISIFSILHIEINFIFVAGILTIIGYSINDTIVVFDLIRDKLKSLKKKTKESLEGIVKECISLSLKRNIITSITTLIAIITLLIMNAKGVKEFNITVLIGLTAGTFSSLLLAPYVWLKLEIFRIHHPKKVKVYNDEVEEKLIKGINS